MNALKIRTPYASTAQKTLYCESMIDFLAGAGEILDDYEMSTRSPGVNKRRSSTNDSSNPGTPTSASVTPGLATSGVGGRHFNFHNVVTSQCPSGAVVDHSGVSVLVASSGCSSLSTPSMSSG